MKRSTRARRRAAPVLAVAIAAAAAVTAVTAFAADPAPTLARSVLGGAWTLVEQTYGDGGANQIRADEPPVRLAFERSGGSLVGTIRAGDARAAAVAWPNLTPDGARSVEVQARELGAREERVYARYRVAPAPGDDLWLVVTEDYRLIENGRALAGTVLVEFERHGEPRGSYVLHRRFERTP